MKRLLFLAALLLTVAPSVWAQAVVVPSPVPVCADGYVLAWSAASSNFICSNPGTPTNFWTRTATTLTTATAGDTVDVAGAVTLDKTVTIGGGTSGSRGSTGTASWGEFGLTIMPANGSDAGILLQPGTGASGFIDFLNESRSGVGNYARIGRNPASVGAALFTGAGGSIGNAFQIGTRDATAVQLFAHDVARVYIDGVSGNVGIGPTGAVGVTLPSEFLDVSKTTAGGVGGVAAISNYNTSAAGNEADLVFKINSNFTAGVASARIKAISPAASNVTDIVFSTWGTAEAERMRISTVTGVTLTGPVVTPGTDSTVVDAGSLRRLRYSTTIAPALANAANCATAFAASATTADCTIATLVAGQKLVSIYADVTTGFTCAGFCTGTQVVQCGITTGGTEVLAAGLNIVPVGRWGLADADLGSGMTRAGAIQGGLIGSWTTTTPISCRFTTGTSTWGTGAATHVNGGVVKFTLITEQMK